MNHVMPLSRRIFFPLTIPIPARHAMCPFSRHPTTIIHPTPSRPVRGDILPPPKIILLGSTPCPGQSRFLTRIPIPPRPIGLQVGTGALGVLLPMTPTYISGPLLVTTSRKRHRRGQWCLFPGRGSLGQIQPIVWFCRGMMLGVF